MTEHRKRILRIARTFAAPVEKVFEAWASEEVLRRWLQGMPDRETRLRRSTSAYGEGPGW